MENEEKNRQYEVVSNVAVFNSSHEVVSDSDTPKTPEYFFNATDTESSRGNISCDNYVESLNMTTKIVQNSAITDLVQSGVLDNEFARSILESTYRAVEEREQSVTELNRALVRKTDAEADFIRLTGEAEVDKKKEEANKAKEEAGKIKAAAGKINAEAEVTRSTGKADAGKKWAEAFVSVAVGLFLLSVAVVFVGGVVFIGYCVLNNGASVDSLIKFSALFVLLCIVGSLRFNVLKGVFEKLFGKLFGG